MSSPVTRSKLSSYPECRQALADTPDCFPLFLEVMSKHRQRQVSCWCPSLFFCSALCYLLWHLITPRRVNGSRADNRSKTQLKLEKNMFTFSSWLRERFSQAQVKHIDWTDWYVQLVLGQPVLYHMLMSSCADVPSPFLAPHFIEWAVRIQGWCMWGGPLFCWGCFFVLWVSFMNVPLCIVS